MSILKPILKNISEFIQVNSGTFLDRSYYDVDRIRRVDSDGDGQTVKIFPAYYDPEYKEPRPLLNDQLRNYAYYRQVGSVSVAVGDPVISCNPSEINTYSIRCVVHYVSNKHNQDDISGFIQQLLNLYDFTRTSSIPIIDVELNVTAINTDIDLVLDEETEGLENIYRSDDRIIAIDFDLVVELQPSDCILVDECVGDLPDPLQQIAFSTTVNVSEFKANCKSITYSEGLDLISNGLVQCNVLYFVTDRNIYLWGINNVDFSIDGWYLDGADIDKISFDYAADELWKRSDKYGNTVTETLAYIAANGNTVNSFPFNNANYQGFDLHNSSFIYAGFTGTAENFTIKNDSSAEISGAGTIKNINIEDSAVIIQLDSGTLNGAECRNNSQINLYLSGGTHADLSAVNSSLLNVFALSSGNMSRVLVSENSNLTYSVAFTQNQDRVIVTNGSEITYTDDCKSIDFVFDRRVCDQYNRTIPPPNQKWFWNSQGSNMYKAYVVNGSNEISINQYIGIVLVDITTSAILDNIKYSSFPVSTDSVDWIIRIEPKNSGDVLTVNKTAPGVAVNGDILNDTNFALTKHSATLTDFAELIYDSSGGVWRVINIKNYV